MTISSIFASALRTAIGDETRIFDYGDKNTFVDLWTMDKKGCPKAFSTGDGSGREEDAAGSGSSVSNEKQSAGEGRSTPGDTIVIVWDEDGGDWDEDGDDRAPSEFDEWTELLKPHLTPMDWALAFSIKILAQDKVPECADVAIHIVDLTGRDHTTWSMRMRHQLLAEMPWVTLYAPLIPKGAYRSGYRPILDGSGSLPNNGGMDSTLGAGTATLKACASRGYGRNLAGLSRQWASTLVQTHDHHDLNNLVGPWILCGIAPPCSTPPLFRAFWNRLRWTGLIPEKTSSETTPLPDIGKLDVVALDDRLYDGWNQVICRLFDADPQKPTTTDGFQSIGSNGKIELYGSKDIRTLSANLQKPGALKERQFDSPIPCSDNERPWLLVLDLLLFPSGSSVERKWLTELLCIAKGASEDLSNLAWSAFSQDEISDVERWLPSGTVEDPAYHTALTLLPRLCALRWPSVPIILFSGTSRRELTDKLSVYRNIFLAPRKPNLLSGNATEETAAFLGGWRREFDRTRGLIEVQRKLRKLQEAGKSGPKNADETSSGETSLTGSAANEGAETNPGIDRLHDNQQHYHFTVAFDESGNFGAEHPADQFSAIGGIIIAASHNSDYEAREHTFDLLEKFRSKGVQFYDHPPVYTDIYENRLEPGVDANSPIAVALNGGKRGRRGSPPHRRILKKGDDISQTIGQVLACHNIRLGAFRYIIPKSLYDTSGPTDGVYMKWLSRCIDLLFCEYLPSIGCDGANVSLSIWLPTRIFPNRTSVEAVQRDQYFDNRANTLHTVGGYSVAYQIVLRSLEGRPNTDELLKKCQLKLRKIPYQRNQNNHCESALHWYCPVHSSFLFPHSVARGNGAPTCRILDKNRRQCGQPLIADYSVSQHLADATIKNNPDCFPHAELGEKNVAPEISFDVEVGTKLEDFLETGRCVDQGRCAEGFMIAFRHDFFVAGLNRDESKMAKAKIHFRIVHRLRKYSASISGDTLLRLAASQSVSAPRSGSTA